MRSGSIECLNALLSADADPDVRDYVRATVLSRGWGGVQLNLFASFSRLAEHEMIHNKSNSD